MKIIFGYCFFYPSIIVSKIYFLRPVVAPYTEISGTLFWSNFITLHRQNTLYNALGLPKECIIYVRVLRKHFKSKSDEYRCFKDARVWACDPYQLHCGTYFEPQTFFKLPLSWIWTARLEANRPVRSQFLFKRTLLTVDSARLDWVYVLTRVPPEESRFLWETTQNNLLFPVTVLPTAT